MVTNSDMRQFEQKATKNHAMEYTGKIKKYYVDKMIVMYPQ